MNMEWINLINPIEDSIRSLTLKLREKNLDLRVNLPDLVKF